MVTSTPSLWTILWVTRRGRRSWLDLDQAYIWRQHLWCNIRVLRPQMAADPARWGLNLCVCMCVCVCVRICACACVCVCVRTQTFSRAQLFASPWTVARQAPLSLEFSRQEYQSRLPFPTPGDLPYPGIKPSPLLCLLHWQVDSLPPHRLGSLDFEPELEQFLAIWFVISCFAHLRNFMALDSRQDI